MAGVTAYVLRDADCEAFRRCRRQWDFGAPERQNWEPVAPPAVVDVRRAVRDALAVYYFPGMWEWPRAMVERLTLEAFARSISRQHADAASRRAEEHEAEELRRAEDVLRAYFRWAPEMDRFSPIRVESDFLINVPHPTIPEQGLVVPDGRPVRYSGRIELLLQDGDGAYWLLDHRIGDVGSAEIEALQLDSRGADHCWAWEDFFLGMKISGSVYNELRWPHGGATGGRGPTQRQSPEGGHFRRLQISRSPQELEQWRKHMGRLALEMIDPALRLYPAPGEHCARCDYRVPCLAMFQLPEGDAAPMDETSFRQRTRETVEEGRLGGATWSVGRGVGGHSV